MNSKKIIELINILLIILSLIIAILLPFQLFLIAYAIVGPLHYLTEINWLYKKKFFISSGKQWSRVLITLAILISLPPLLKFEILGKIESLINVQVQESFGGNVLVCAFLFAISLVYIKKGIYLYLSLVLSVVFSLLLSWLLPEIVLIIGVLLPTIIHVYFFTFFFIIYGAKKARSSLGLVNAIVLLTIPVIILLIEINPDNYSIPVSLIENYQLGGFQKINIMIANAFKVLASDFNLISEFGLKIQIFISFSYIYHYLNWFSKTSIIGWGKALNLRSSLKIAFFWILSVIIFAYDFKLGLTTLLALSFLHVFLEFPLNVTTIKGLFK